MPLEREKTRRLFFVCFSHAVPSMYHLMAILHWLGKKLSVRKARETEEAVAETERQAHQGSEQLNIGGL